MRQNDLGVPVGKPLIQTPPARIQPAHRAHMRADERVRTRARAHKVLPDGLQGKRAGAAKGKRGYTASGSTFHQNQSTDSSPP